MDISSAKKEVIAAGHELISRGLVARTWGNVSCRIDAQYFAITPSGIGYERLSENEIVVVNIKTLEYEGNIKPSSEKGIHAAAYAANASTNFVIHTHQTYATCLSVAGSTSIALTDEESALLGSDIGLAHYGLPSTKKLMRNVEGELKLGCNAILMANHGALISGTNCESTFTCAIALEEICKRTTIAISLTGEYKPEIAGQKTDAGAAIISIHTPTAASASGLEALHGAIYAKHKNCKYIAHVSSPIIAHALQQTGALPAVLDDFAQIVGRDLLYARQAANINDVLSKLRGRSAVYISGLGLCCIASSETDCEAIAALAEKNALTYLNAAQYGSVKPLSSIDRALMRLIYTQKYSKKK